MDAVTETEGRDMDAERIRLVGPNKEGARGSYSIYKVAD